MKTGFSQTRYRNIFHTWASLTVSKGVHQTGCFHICKGVHQTVFLPAKVFIRLFSYLKNAQRQCGDLWRPLVGAAAGDVNSNRYAMQRATTNCRLQHPLMSLGN